MKQDNHIQQEKPSASFFLCVSSSFDVKNATSSQSVLCALVNLCAAGMLGINSFYVRFFKKKKSLIFLLPASLSTMGSNCFSVNQRLNYLRSFERKERKEEAKIESQTLKSSSESGNLQQ